MRMMMMMMMMITMMIRSCFASIYSHTVMAIPSDLSAHPLQ